MSYRDNCGICGESYDDENLIECSACGVSFCYRCGDSGGRRCARCQKAADALEKPEMPRDAASDADDTPQRIGPPGSGGPFNLPKK